MNGYLVIFNKHTNLLTTLISSSSSLFNLKSNSYNKNDTRRKKATQIQYSTRRSAMMMTTTTTTATTISITIMMTMTMTITMTNTSVTDGLG